MADFCRLCGSLRRSTRFKKGVRYTRVCATCKKLTPEARHAIEAEQEIRHFLFGQSHISRKNLRRLRALGQSGDPTIAALAAAVHAVALAAPYKRRRFRVLARRRDLIDQLVTVGLLMPREPRPPEYEPDAFLDELPGGLYPEALYSDELFEEAADEPYPREEIPF